LPRSTQVTGTGRSPFAGTIMLAFSTRFCLPPTSSSPRHEEHHAAGLIGDLKGWHGAARIDFRDLERPLLKGFVQRQVVMAVGAWPLESEHLQSGRLPDSANLGAPQSFEHIRLGEQHKHPL